jgi:hypothetical protein
MIFGAAVYRLLPHPTNLAPVAAMALVSGAAFKSRWLSIVIPLLAMFMSDAALQAAFGIGFHVQMFSVYSALAITVALGWSLKKMQWSHILPTSLIASSLFFLITNFSVWALEANYPKTAAGLLACYVAAIPFFDRTLLGDLFFAAIFFGLLKWASARALIAHSASSNR